MKILFAVKKQNDILPVVLLIIFVCRVLFVSFSPGSIFQPDLDSICIDRWRINRLFLGSEFICCSCCWIYCIVRTGGRNRNCDGDLSQ